MREAEEKGDYKKERRNFTQLEKNIKTYKIGKGNIGGEKKKMYCSKEKKKGGDEEKKYKNKDEDYDGFTKHGKKIYEK